MSNNPSRTVAAPGEGEEEDPEFVVSQGKLTAAASVHIQNGSEYACIAFLEGIGFPKDPTVYINCSFLAVQFCRSTAPAAGFRQPGAH